MVLDKFVNTAEGQYCVVLALDVGQYYMVKVTDLLHLSAELAQVPYLAFSAQILGKSLFIQADAPDHRIRKYILVRDFTTKVKTKCNSQSTI